jgi:hypothetical protein
LSGHFPSADPPTPSGLGSLAGLFAPTRSGLGSANLLEPTPSNPLTVGALSGHFPSSDPATPFGALYPPPAPPPKPVTPTVKRKAFFSFHYGPDIMRTNVVRNAWRITHPDNALTGGFFDGSLWEDKKLEGDEAR